jgi:hypothetical protein
MRPLGASLSLNFTLPEATMFALTVPRVPSQRASIEPDGDATLRAAGGRYGSDSELKVSTAEDVSVAVVKFSTNGRIGDRGIVSAVLQLHLKASNTPTEQLLTVLGLTENWDESSVEWGGLQALKTPSVPVDSTAKNFINWGANPAPMPVGHVTVPPSYEISSSSGMKLRLDVTDAVRRGITSFLVLRPFRMDESPGSPPSRLPADVVQGTYIFASRDSPLSDHRPLLLIDYEVIGNPPPPFNPPPPPPPEPYVEPPYQEPPYTQYGDDETAYDLPPPSSPPPPPPRRSPPPPPPVCARLRGQYRIQSVACPTRFLSYAFECPDARAALLTRQQAPGLRTVWTLDATVGAFGGVRASSRNCTTNALASMRALSLGSTSNTWRYRFISSRGSCNVFSMAPSSAFGRGLYLGVKNDCTSLFWRRSATTNTSLWRVYPVNSTRRKRSGL